MTRTRQIRVKVKRLNGLLYKLFSHRYLIAFVAVATVALIAQLTIMSVALAASFRGATALEGVVNSALNAQAVANEVRRTNSTATLVATTLTVKPANASVKRVNLIGGRAPPSTGHKSVLARRAFNSTFASLSLSNAILDGATAPQRTFFQGTATNGEVYNLSLSCAAALVAPYKDVVRLRRTDVAIIVFQLWVWGLLMFGLTLESVPHLFAVILSHFLNIVSTGLQFQGNQVLRQNYDPIIRDGACKDADMLPHYWGAVVDMGVASLCIECSTIIALTFLAMKVHSVLDWRTFRKLGASRKVRTAHTVGLLFTILIHLDAYFSIAFQGIWLSELMDHPWMPEMQEDDHSLKIILIVLISLTIPWLLAGSFAKRDKSTFGMICFVGFDIAMLSFNLFLVSGRFYHQAAEHWAILSFLGLTNCVLLFATLLVAVGCMFTFSSGNESTFSNEDEEKARDEKVVQVAFPDEVVAFSVHTDPWSKPKSNTLTDNEDSSVSLPVRNNNNGLPVRGGLVERSDTASSWLAGDENRMTVTARPGGNPVQVVSRFSASTATDHTWSTNSGKSFPFHQ